MIIRIVRMHFKTECVQEFLVIFQANMQAIRNFDGCSHLELLTEAGDKNIFTTLSHWSDQSKLNNYRNSELFNTVWKQVKPMFYERPQAFSFERYIEVF